MIEQHIPVMLLLNNSTKSRKSRPGNFAEPPFLIRFSLETVLHCQIGNTLSALYTEKNHGEWLAPATLFLFGFRPGASKNRGRAFIPLRPCVRICGQKFPLFFPLNVQFPLEKDRTIQYCQKTNLLENSTVRESLGLDGLLFWQFKSCIVHQINRCSRERTAVFVAFPFTFFITLFFQIIFDQTTATDRQKAALRKHFFQRAPFCSQHTFFLARRGSVFSSSKECSPSTSGSLLNSRDSLNPAVRPSGGFFPRQILGVHQVYEPALQQLVQTVLRLLPGTLNALFHFTEVHLPAETLMRGII